MIIERFPTSRARSRASGAADKSRVLKIEVPRLETMMMSTSRAKLIFTSVKFTIQGLTTFDNSRHAL